ncbi:hypothetical protein CO038_03015 [Candidatus Pacearchaeota archaeon CG_4_9_14_0_2_um_filter_39_13]|nr:hypothetical protein [Candidatus Pacearchaeota archaeon]OIO42160.1 MAG: hypothetical protein AUJ64_04290 [Candidatus Pacearchaeota archaeon CG1_02_39_14]PJC44538.1 MAG: hypothetical protein CO038_03015 [Candidatus Pacearchaeota archaeon CG_4_9_14_0_2_um_filter_39_13]
MATILQNPFFIELVLPFLLVFVVMFAILQKTKIFGDGKRQIDAIIALVIGLIVVAFGNAVGIIVSLMPFLAVTAVIILVFMILYGMVYKEGEFEMSHGLKIAFGILIGIGLLIAVLFTTGAWDYILENWVYGSGGDIFINIVFFVVIIGAVAAVFWGGGKGDKK